MNKYRSFYIILVFVLALSGCAPTPPEAPFVSVETIVAATYAVIQAQTEAVIPTATIIPPTPTKLFVTFTPVATSTSFIVSSLTPVPTFTTAPSLTPTNVTSGSGDVLYSCEVVKLSPESGYDFKKNQKFTWTIRVKNNGTARWDRGDTKIAHIKGAEYYIDRRVLLEETTEVGEFGEFHVELISPNDPGRYTSTWTMRKGIHNFCVIKYQIFVLK